MIKLKVIDYYRNYVGFVVGCVSCGVFFFGVILSFGGLMEISELVIEMCD